MHSHTIHAYVAEALLVVDRSCASIGRILGIATKKGKTTTSCEPGGADHMIHTRIMGAYDVRHVHGL